MKSHRHPRTSVSNTPAPDNFDPAAALESLHTEIVDIEALAHAAGEAVTLLPRPALGTHLATGRSRTPKH